MSAAEDSSRALMDRISSLLPDQQLREVRMFGVLALMVDGAMAVAAHKDGSLLVRVAATDDARLLKAPGASRAQMGAGRSMGEGWLRVEATLTPGAYSRPSGSVSEMTPSTGVKPSRRYSPSAASLSGSVCRDKRTAPSAVAAARTASTKAAPTPMRRACGTT